MSLLNIQLDKIAGGAQAAIDALDAKVDQTVSNLTDLMASAVSNLPAGSIAAVTVQDALDELATEKQPIDADLTAIAAISPANDDIIQRKAGSWINRTIAQLKTDLDLNNCDNTADSNKPVSTAQAAADAVVAATIANETQNAQTGTTYTLVPGDKGKRVTLSNASAITLTVDNSFAVGDVVNLQQIGAGQVTVVGSGVTVNATPGLKFRAQHSGASLWKQASGVYWLTGDLSA